VVEMKNSKNSGRIARISEIYPSTKGVLDAYDIFIVISRHVETVVRIERE